MARKTRVGEILGLLLALPLLAPGATLITSTDRVAGFGSTAPRKIGRGRVRKGMVATFERLFAAVKR